MARKSVNKATKYPSPLQYRWQAGPYHPPRVNIGVVLHDEYRGDVRVDGMTDAPIPWPGYTYNKGLHSGLLPVLTGDLVRAVCEEEEVVVCHYWGITRHMVNQWKCALAEATNSDQVALKLALKRQDPQFRKKYGYT
jgi:hypothetical protein